MSASAGQLALGLFGVYNMQQSLKPTGNWASAGAATGCTSAVAESQMETTSGSMGASEAASNTSQYMGGVLTFADAPAASLTLPPVNTAAPTISGTARQGSVLSATSGTWTGSPTSYAYQWQDCSLLCSNIAGATGSTYTPQSSDVGSTIDVVVSASNAGGSTSATSGRTSSVQKPLAPVNTALPTISGTAQQADTVTASSGSWSNSPSSYAYQWQDCSSSACSDIVNATGSSYTLQSSDVGSTVDVVVMATNAGGSTSATSAQTGSVQAPPPAAPVNTAAPTISGTAQQGDTLTASKGSWSNSPSSYGYQWQDCSSSSSCSNISGATGSTYVLQSSDVGSTVDVVVMATNAGGSTSAGRRPIARVVWVSVAGLLLVEQLLEHLGRNRVDVCPAVLRRREHG